MRKAAEIKLFDDGNVSFFIEKDFTGLTIIKQQPDPDSSDTTDRIHTRIGFTFKQAYFIVEALREIQDLDNIEPWQGKEEA